MSSGITRRDALRFLGGGALGTLLTPLPWKLLDDTAIWTQTKARVVRLPRGPITTRSTRCSLCPAGCALRVRCVAGHPMAVAGVPLPGRAPGLCALGLAAHHLVYHPRRLRSALVSSGDVRRTVAVESAVDLLADWAEHARRTGGRVVVLDPRPERDVSSLYRRWLGALGCGTYAVESAASSSDFEAQIGIPPLRGIELGRCRTIVSFGAPMLEGHLARAWRGAGGERGFELIQIESRPSRTALAADRWVQIRPGGETALALGLASVLLEAGLADRAALARASDRAAYEALVRQFPPERAAALSGVSSDTIHDIAQRLGSHGPAAVIAGVDPGGGPLQRSARTAIAALRNLVPNAAYSARWPIPDSENEIVAVEWSGLDVLPDAAIQLLVLDASLPCNAVPRSLLRRKLAPGGRVAALSAFDAGGARYADLVVPVPAPFEAWTDIPAAGDAPVASWAISAPLVVPRQPCIELAALVYRLAERTAPGLLGAPVSTAERLQRRTAAIHARGRGSVCSAAGAERIAVADFPNAAMMWDSLCEGGKWEDDDVLPVDGALFTFLGHERGEDLLRAALSPAAAGSMPLVLAPYAASLEAASGALPPILSKLYRESRLLAAGGDAVLHPSTAASCGLGRGEWATLETERGRARVRVRRDVAVLPGVVHVAIGPDDRDFGDGDGARGAAVLDLCRVEGDGTWRWTPARLTPARAGEV